jgi:BirA family transcriptional regulator, biotin operon repressor / biotin---[acetyl-CoA-carboxylase] ligase
MRLDPAAADLGVRLVALATIGSTNKEGSDRARRGEQGPLWITAQAQTAGRGRLGRSWTSPPGNLYASLLVTDPAPFERAPELAFVAVLALRDAIAVEAPALVPQLSFKWPNDLLLNGEKCAGILIEGEVEPGKSMWVVIGIGVNCAHHPAAASVRRSDDAKPTVLYPTTDLRSHGAEMMPEQLFQRLSATMCRRIAQWDRGRGLPAILGDWLSAASGLGEEIRVRNDSGEKTGRFVGLDRAGRLLLQRPGGAVEKIAAGDVFPLARCGGRMIPSRQS